MFVKFNKIKNNKRVRKGVSWVSWGFGMFLTGTSVLYSYDYLKSKIQITKKRIFEIYDDDVIETTNELIKESIKKGFDMDYDETLNKLQEIKNLKKMKKRED